jgi:DMSO/TMAO reductase YedYZ molybdopterin-dependent catalytic subunit
VILAYEMNGRPLPLDNGFPLRFICPSWPQLVKALWVWLLIVLVPGFGSGVWLLSEWRRQVLPGVPGCAPAPTAPGRFSFRVDGMFRAGQAGASPGDLERRDPVPRNL